MVCRPHGTRRRLENARDGASDKCRRLCFNCGVCSLALYKCSSFHSTFRLSLSLFLFFLHFSVSLPPRGAIAKNHLIARRIEIFITRSPVIRHRTFINHFEASACTWCESVWLSSISSSITSTLRHSSRSLILLSRVLSRK